MSYAAVRLRNSTGTLVSLEKIVGIKTCRVTNKSTKFVN